MDKPQKDLSEKTKTKSKGTLKTIYPTKYYKVGPGNNSALVDRVIRSRPWWRRVTDDKFRAQFIWQQSSKGLFFDRLNTQQLANHLPWGIELGSKMRLFQNCSKYLESKGMNPFGVFPVTYLINPGEKNDFNAFEQHYNWLNENKEVDSPKYSAAPQVIRKACKKTPPKSNEHNLWIVKPLGFNRGLGITVVNTPAQASEWMKKGQEGQLRLSNDVEKPEEGENKDKGKFGPRITKWIIQKYIEHPLLFNGRKFDLRMYMLVTGKGDAYFYRDGYLRMASSIYSSDDLSREVHLTNNAVQKRLSSYGCDEAGNMRTLASLDEYVSNLLLKRYGNNKNEDGTTYSYVTQYLHPRMKEIIAYSAASAVTVGNQDSTSSNCFELYGVDFMIDDSLNAFLIEMNVNPCLELACNVSWSILPYLLDDVLALTLDSQLSIQPSIFTTEIRGQSQKDNNDNNDTSSLTAAESTKSETYTPEGKMDKNLRKILLATGDKAILRCDSECPSLVSSSSRVFSESSESLHKGVIPTSPNESSKARKSSDATSVKSSKINEKVPAERRLRSPSPRMTQSGKPNTNMKDVKDNKMGDSSTSPNYKTSSALSSPLASNARKITKDTNKSSSPVKDPHHQKHAQSYIPPKTFPYDAWPVWANTPKPTWPAWAGIGVEKENKDQEGSTGSVETVKDALENHIRLRWDAITAKGDYPVPEHSTAKRTQEEIAFLQKFRHRPNNFEMVMSRFRPLKVKHVKLELPKEKKEVLDEAKVENDEDVKVEDNKKDSETTGSVEGEISALDKKESEVAEVEKSEEKKVSPK